MKTSVKDKAVLAVRSVAVAAAFIALCIPAFKMTGIIIKPLALCVCGVAAITAVVCFSKRWADIVGIALLLTVCFWLFVAVAIQIKLQIEAGWVHYWIFCFYFDKLLIVGTVWLTATMIVAIRRLFVKNTASTSFNLFFRLSGTAFFIFYVFLLLFSFVFCRLESGSSYPINLQLFSTVKDYIKDLSTIPYEVFMMFFGNLFYFTPLGYIFCILLKNKKSKPKAVFLIAFPLVAFSLLELSQYLLQNGFCEIDDMIMNSIGFWIGALVYPLTNRITRRVSNNRIQYFWN